MMQTLKDSKIFLRRRAMEVEVAVAQGQRWRRHLAKWVAGEEVQVLMRVRICVRNVCYVPFLYTFGG